MFNRGRKMLDKEDRVNKRIKKRTLDKKHKKIPWKAQELLDAKVILEEEYCGFPLQLLELKKGGFKVVSSFFKKGCSSGVRKTSTAALNQGHYLVYALMNYVEERGMLTDEALEYVETTDIICLHPFSKIMK